MIESEQTPLQSCFRTKKRKRETNRVCFAEHALLYSSARTASEISQTWYSKHELDLFKKERILAIRALKEADFDTSRVSICLRGYEAYFSVELNRAMKHARNLNYTLVFAEQNRQRFLDIIDEELVKECSLMATKWARETAIRLGSLDASDSAKIYAEDLRRIQDFCKYAIYDDGPIFFKDPVASSVLLTGGNLLHALE